MIRTFPTVIFPVHSTSFLPILFRHKLTFVVQYESDFCFVSWRIVLRLSGWSGAENQVTKLETCSYSTTPQWGTADAEIKIPSIDSSLFEGLSGSVYSPTCYAYCQGFLPCKVLLFRSIYLHLFQNLFWVFPVLALASTGSCVGLQNKRGHPAHKFPG